MPGWVKVVLILVAYLIACYALGISPSAIPAGLVHGLEQMHQQAVNGRLWVISGSGPRERSCRNIRI